MEEANYRNDQALHATAQQIFRNAIEAGWDEEYGGLLYFIDCLGKPTEAYEHDMKLWWPHNEILKMCIRDSPCSLRSNCHSQRDPHFRRDHLGCPCGLCRYCPAGGSGYRVCEARLWL